VLVHATPTQGNAIVRAMKCVATGDGAVALSPVDIAAIEACHHVVLHRAEPLDVAALPPLAPAELAGLVGGGGVGEHTVQFLAVVALVDGSVRPERIDAVARYSEALGLHGLVLHPGACTGGSDEGGLDRIAGALLDVVGRRPRQKARVLLRLALLKPHSLAEIQRMFREY